MTAVPVNASGSREDDPNARNVARVSEAVASGHPVALVLDSPPYDSTCRVTLKSGKQCGNALTNDVQRQHNACYRHYWRK